MPDTNGTRAAAADRAARRRRTATAAVERQRRGRGGKHAGRRKVNVGASRMRLTCACRGRYSEILLKVFNWKHRAAVATRIGGKKTMTSVVFKYILDFATLVRPEIWARKNYIFRCALSSKQIEKLSDVLKMFKEINFDNPFLS